MTDKFHSVRYFLLTVVLTFTGTTAQAQQGQLGTPPRFSDGVTAAQKPAQPRPAVEQGWIDITDREAVREFYNSVLVPSETVPMGWVGDVTAGDAGTTSQAYKDAVALRVNWFRSMAGVPPCITLDEEFSRKAQQAALIMSANGALSHFPTAEDWLHFSEDGAEAARMSNICLGFQDDPGCVQLYMTDSGANNAAVGHRRWILHPQTKMMGTGDIPAHDSFFSANALWVFDDLIFEARPETREEFVAWPPPGFVPEPVVFRRWSFSYRRDADFENATVAMQRNGMTVPLTLEPVESGFGEDTIVWVPDEVAALPAGARPQAAGDVTTIVTVDNVIIDGQARSFTYEVTVFNPAVGTPPPAPAITQEGVVSSASFVGGSVTPGEILSFFGTAVGPSRLVGLTFDENGNVTRQLGPTRILFDGQPAPMVFTRSDQSSAITPFFVAGQPSTTIEVEVNGVLSNTVTLPVAATRPGIFSVNQSGSDQGAVLNQDFSRNKAGNPAARGSVVQIFLTGGGQTDPGGADGEPAPLTPPFPTLEAPVSVTIGGRDARVFYQGAAPGLVHGVAQINAGVDAGVTPGDSVPLEVTIGGVPSQPGITIAVE